MNRVLQCDFELTSHAQKHIFSTAVGCSQALISTLESLTNQQFSTNGKKIVPDDNLTANIPCRYCGRNYSIQNSTSKEFWIGLYFNNIPFTPDYRLILAVDTKYTQKLQNEGINYSFYNFPFVQEKWLYINLDNYLLHCDIQEIETEINRILQIIL